MSSLKATQVNEKDKEIAGLRKHYDAYHMGKKKTEAGAFASKKSRTRDVEWAE